MKPVTDLKELGASQFTDEEPTTKTKKTKTKTLKTKEATPWDDELCNDCIVTCERDAPEHIERCREEGKCYFYTKR